MPDYDAQSIEPKWQRVWDAQGAARADIETGPTTRPKFYMLEMLPYPSGTLHMGHMRNYTIGDAVARYKRLRGFNVMHPLGWDAFGLPAENAAIQRGIHPREWTLGNVAEFKRVCSRFGFSYDWRREISTCDPEYYKWNQWFFLRMLERGLAYRKKSRVNWCPKCQTVLANEQVVDGMCWRHEDTQVLAKEIEQWFFRITKYADQLLDDMAEIEAGWPERVLTMQRNWIGKSRGARVRFAVEGMTKESIEIFTTRVDTIYGAVAVILAPAHPLVPLLLEGAPNRAAMETQIAEMRRMSVKTEDLETAEKIGFPTGRFARNPFNGEKIPIWIANFVLMEYGAGAIMCVPSGDQRDFEFCKKYGLPIRVVVNPLEGDTLDAAKMTEAFTHYGRAVNTGPYSGLKSEEAIARMTADAEKKGFGKGETIFRLKDWGISRQRYWGTPIPILYCAACGLVPVPDKDLPVVLPAQVAITGEGKSPLATVDEWVSVKCPKCAGPARRETDTMDTFVDSSWYFFRYADPHNDNAPFDPAVARYWLPVDQYVGGIVHAILHLLYSRFFCKVMRDLGLVQFNEPVTRLFCQGTVTKGGAAMSKSKGNVVGAIDMAERYGADTARVYSLFAAPPEKDMEWNEQGIEGCSRFLHRLHRLVEKHAARIREWRALGTSAPAFDLHDATEKEKSLLRKAHQTVRRITEDFEKRWHFNTSVAAMMELMNALHDAEPLDKDLRPRVLVEVFELFARMLEPFAPHLAEELWEMLGHSGGIARAGWPAYRAELAAEEQFEVVIQVNGKLRGKILVGEGVGEAEVIKLALAEPKVAEMVNGKKVVKQIVVPKKLVNLVVQ